VLFFTRRLGGIACWFAVAGLYALLALAVLAYFPARGAASVAWPASGLALAVLLVCGKRHAPGVALGAWLASVLAGVPASAALAVAAGDSLAVLFGVWLVGRGAGFDPALRAPRDGCKLLLLAGVLGMLPGAAIGTAALDWAGVLAPGAYFGALAHWYGGDVLGVALLTPLLLVWRQAPRDWLEPGRRLEALLLLGLFALAGYAVFFHGAGDGLGLAYGLFLLAAAVAMRLGRHGAVLASATVALQALWGARLGLGIFAGDLAGTAGGHYWMFSMALTVAGLAVAMYSDEFKRLSERLRLAAMVFEHSNEGILVTDEHNHILSVNPMFQTITGYSEAEALGKTPGMLLRSGKQDEAFYQSMWQALQHKGHWQGELWNRCKHGEIYAEWLSIATRRNPQGAITHHLAIFSDITVRKQAEEALWAFNDELERKVRERTAELQESQSRLEAIIDNLPEVFFMKDLQGRYLAVNRCCESVLGIGRELVIGRTDRELFAQELAEAFIATDQEVLRSGQPANVEDARLHPDGTLHDYSTTVFPLHDQNGKIYALAGIGSDVSQAKQLQRDIIAAKDAAERLAQAKSEFLANMSHEIRTPLHAVLGLARIGERDSRGRSVQGIFLRILDSGQHLLNVINDVLDFSKIESGKLVLENQPFRLADIVEESVGFVLQLAHDKGLELNVVYLGAPSGEAAGSATSVAAWPEWVSGDSLRLEQILVNLLSNAVKFTERGTVSLTVMREGEVTLFRVSDSGIGMTETQIARLFSAFTQADGAITRQYGGSGLGLAISLQLAQAMGGDIMVASWPGIGSTFTLQLPLPAAEAPDSSPCPAPAKGTRLAGLRVLVAEDVEVNRFILEDFLLREGAQAVFAENGAQALDRVQTAGAEAFDVVLMDVQMPVMDGREATRRIHALAPELPIIGLTAHALADERERCLLAGMAEHISKPINTEVLVAALLRLARPAALANDPASSAASADATPEPREAAAWAGGQDGLIDQGALLERFNGRWGFIAKLAATMRETHRETPAKLRAAASSGDGQVLAFLAHSLKGLAGNLEAASVSGLAERTARTARAGSEEAFSLGSDLAEALDKLLAELAQIETTHGDH
jgi:PAS domain S-box-containing protein